MCDRPARTKFTRLKKIRRCAYSTRCTILVTKFASCALYAVPRVCVKIEVYFGLNGCYDKVYAPTVMWSQLREELRWDLLYNQDQGSSGRSPRQSPRYSVDCWIDCQSVMLNCGIRAPLSPRSHLNSSQTLLNIFLFLVGHSLLLVVLMSLWRNALLSFKLRHLGCC